MGAAEPTIGGNAAPTARSAQGGAGVAGRAGGRAWAVPIVLGVLALALFLPRLGTPDRYVFDELYYAYTAGRYVAGDAGAYRTDVPPRDDPAIEWTHPPLGKLIIAGSILVLGDDPLGWRLANVLFGAAGVALTALLAYELTGSRVVAAVAGGLLLLDGLYLVESRTGTANVFLVVFATGALLALAKALTAPVDRIGRPLLAAGVLLGLALATKWSAVALLGLAGLAVAWRALRAWRMAGAAGAAGRGATAGTGDAAAERRVARSGAWRVVGWGAASLVVVPAAIYLLSWSHYFSLGYGWSDLVDLHATMLTYHRELGTVHARSSPWWQWPLAARPVWYFADAGRRIGAFVFGNGTPLLYWPMVVAVAWVAIDWWGRRPVALAVLLIGFFGQWLPWALAPRGTFVYHFLPAVPLGCIALAIVVVDAWARGGWRRPAAAAYVLAVVATFAFFYPLQTAVPLTPDQVDLRMWFPSWR